MQFMVTSRMKSQLLQLGYLPDEMERLNPQRAAVIIDRSITRPSSGIPASWMSSSAASKMGPLAALKRAVSPVLRVGASAGVGLLIYLSSGGTLPPAQQRYVDQVAKWLEKAVKKPPTRYRPPAL